jgi:hypothetical protein
MIEHPHPKIPGTYDPDCGLCALDRASDSADALEAWLGAAVRRYQTEAGTYTNDLQALYENASAIGRAIEKARWLKRQRPAEQGRGQ